MPSKRSPAGYFTIGIEAYEPFLKVSGWRSEYRSVQKLLNHLARRIKSEGSGDSYLSWLYRFCRSVGKAQDEVVAMDPRRIRESVQESVDNAWTTAAETGNLARAALGAFLKSNGFDGSDRPAIQDENRGRWKPWKMGRLTIREMVSKQARKSERLST